MIWNHSETSELIMKKLSDQNLRSYLEKIETKTLLAYGVYQVEANGLDLFKSIKGDMVIVPICPIEPITPIGSTPYREGILKGQKVARNQ